MSTEQFMVKMETTHKLTKQGYQSKSLLLLKSGPEWLSGGGL